MANTLKYGTTRLERVRLQVAFIVYALAIIAITAGLATIYKWHNLVFVTIALAIKLFFEWRYQCELDKLIDRKYYASRRNG